MVHNDVNYKDSVLSSAMIQRGLPSISRTSSTTGKVSMGAGELKGAAPSVLDGRLFRFDSGFTRDAVYSRTLWKQRIRLHKTAADFLDTNYGESRSGSDPLNLFLYRHYKLAEEKSKLASLSLSLSALSPSSTRANAGDAARGSPAARIAASLARTRRVLN